MVSARVEGLARANQLVVITGANQGGKSTFLRSVGMAQLMMQAGRFVGAEEFSAHTCAGVFTHFKREEDTTMTRGKLEEELHRMSEIADTIQTTSLLLCIGGSSALIPSCQPTARISLRIRRADDPPGMHRPWVRPVPLPVLR